MSRYSDGRGFRVNMSVPELGAALDQISAYDGRARLGIETAVRNSTGAIGAGSRRRVPVRSGKLKKSISTRTTSNKYGRGLIEGIVAAKQPHAHLVEFGAKATTVRPSKMKALRIVDKGMVEGTGGQYGFAFARVAHIPKRAAHPFMRPAFEDEKPNLIRAIAEAVKP